MEPGNTSGEDASTTGDDAGLDDDVVFSSPLCFCKREHHIASVNSILSEIEDTEKPVIMVFNKIDAYSYQPMEEFDLVKTKDNFSLDDWKNTWMAKMSGNCVFISATQKDNIQELREMLYQVASKIHATRFPFNQFLY